MFAWCINPRQCPTIAKPGSESSFDNDLGQDWDQQVFFLDMFLGKPPTEKSAEATDIFRMGEGGGGLTPFHSFWGCFS